MTVKESGVFILLHQMFHLHTRVDRVDEYYRFISYICSWENAVCK